ncbi:MAG: TRAP transporter permease [Oscillospiraceae bacterium]
MSLFKKHADAASEKNPEATDTTVNPDVGTAADIEEVMRKYDRESNTRVWEGVPQVITRYFMAFFSLYCVYMTLFSSMGIEKRLTCFLGFIVIIGFLNYPVSKHHVKVNSLPWYDIVIMVLGAGAFFYFAANADAIIKVATKINGFQVLVGVIGILTLMELCRRCVGLPILCVAGALLVYAFLSGIKLQRIIYFLFYTTNGVLTTPVSVCAKYIVVFIIFGAFLERTGIATFFINLANSVAGASSGGPAKVAVISSALCGMVSGSSVGNTVTTGSVTIPMMKKTGYDANFAGAVEASASTGGQIMPPIMGAAAFLMAEYMGVSYGEVAMRAILPAVLYFLGIFIAVHLEAKRLGLRGIPKSELPKLGGLMKKIYLLAPMVVMIWLVTTNTRSMQFSAAIAILVTIFVSLFNKDDRITPKKFIDALEAGAKGTITVAAACSIAGIIAGCITVTGLASKLIGAVVMLSGGVPIIGLALTMICCIILGMGVPTTANYCIMAATCAPILIQMGIPKMAAHFFVFYFGIVADITPPVALAAYAGAAIAKGDPMKTGINATKLAIAAFIVPYIFALSPSMLFINTTPIQVIEICFTAVLGIFGVAAAMNGFLYRRIPWPGRAVFLIGGLTLMIPGLVTDIIGFVLISSMVVYQYMGNKNSKTPKPV